MHLKDGRVVHENLLTILKAGKAINYYNVWVHNLGRTLLNGNQ
ncbi:hypothetical protein C7427_105248 [Pantoea ananatis]|nr:hypothetical protein C7427_105248 [Pantoea ananatis]